MLFFYSFLYNLLRSECLQGILQEPWSEETAMTETRSSQNNASMDLAKGFASWSI